MRLFFSKTLGNKKHFATLVFIGLFTMFGFNFFITTTAVHADTVNFDTETNPENLFKAIRYYHGLVDKCIGDGVKETIEGNDIDGGPRRWATDQQFLNIGIVIDKWGDQNGRTDCSGEIDSGGWFADALKLFGFTGKGENLLKQLGYSCKVEDGKKKCTVPSKDPIYNAIKNSPYLKGTSINVKTGERYSVAKYWAALQTIKKSCSAKKGGSENLVEITTVDTSSPPYKVSKANWTVEKGNIRAGVEPVYEYSYGNTDSCNPTLTNAITDNASVYQKWLAKQTCTASYPDLKGVQNEWCAKGLINSPSNLTYCLSALEINDVGPGGNITGDYRKACFLGAGHPVNSTGAVLGIHCATKYAGNNTLIGACIAGGLNRSDPSYCETNYRPNSESSVAAMNACIAAQKEDFTGGGKLTPPIGLVEDEGNDDSSPTTCAVDGIGWLVCPIVTATAAIVDGLYGWVSSYLETPALNTDTASTSNTLYIAWSAMRTVANVAFVIAFIIIIYSQLAGGLVSNYGVKKLLPRLIIAAILVNVSYWVCAIAVDVSNIIGKGVYNILTNISLGTITVEANNVWENVLGWLLAAGATAATVTAGATVISAGSFGALLEVGMWAAIVFVLLALLSLIIAFFIIALRQALIIVLIMVSPLAFVAFLLPNTEKFFTIWRKALITALVFYPLFAMLFGGANLASKVIIGAAQDSGMLVLIGMFIQVAPLFITPLLIRFSSGIVGTVAGMVNNKQKGLIDRARNVRNRKAGLFGHETLGNSNNARNPFGRLYRRVNNSRLGDEERKQAVDTRNSTGYAQSVDGKNRSLDSSLASSQLAAAKSDNEAAYEEIISGKKGVNFDQKYIQLEGQTAAKNAFINQSRKSMAQEAQVGSRATALRNDQAFAKAAAGVGGDRGATRVIAGAQAALDEAEEKALKAASLGIDEGLAAIKAQGGNADKYLENIVNTSQDKDAVHAAINRAASLGRDGLVRKFQANPKLDQARIQQMISANAGALIGKAPDLVKGAGPAFDNIKGSDLVNFSADTARVFTERLKQLGASASQASASQAEKDAYNSALASFQSAIGDIKANPTLQAQFGGDVGKAIISAAGSSGINGYIPNAIGPDGKIR